MHFKKKRQNDHKPNTLVYALHMPGIEAGPVFNVDTMEVGCV